MSDHVSDLQWDRLLADELPADASEAVRAHADKCVACASRLRELTDQCDAFRERASPFFGLTFQLEHEITWGRYSRLKKARIFELADKAARMPNNVLLLGGTYVHRRIIAKSIHRRSYLHRRCSIHGQSSAPGPFVELKCTGLSVAVLESELFGSERELFGTMQTKFGLLESAAGGTVFLDGISEMPMEVQAKLLRAIEQRIVQHVGAIQSSPIDVRIICGTDLDPEAKIGCSRFRANFFDRISQFSIHIPLSRKRGDVLDGEVLQFENAKKPA